MVLTDGDEKPGREVAVRFEQMRAVFGQLLARNRVNLLLPIDICPKSDDAYATPLLRPRVIILKLVFHRDQPGILRPRSGGSKNWRAISHRSAGCY